MTICEGCALHADGECLASPLALAFWMPTPDQCAMREDAEQQREARHETQLSIPGL